MTTNAPIITADVTKRTIFADPKMVKREKGFNPRFDFGDIKELEDSIKATGFHPHKPLLVRRDGEGYVLVDGDRRLTAVENLIKKGHEFPEGIPLAVASKDMTPVQLLAMAYTANGGKPFLPLEEAAAFKRMMELGGLTKKQVCELTGRSQMHVYEALALIEADEEVTDAVKAGKVSASLGKKIAAKAKGDKTKQKELTKRATSGKQGKKAVEEELNRTTRRKLTKKEATPKLKPLGPNQLAEAEAKAVKQLQEAAGNLGMDVGEAVVNIKSDDMAVLGFWYGVQLALQLSQGHKVTLGV